MADESDKAGDEGSPAPAPVRKKKKSARRAPGVSSRPVAARPPIAPEPAPDGRRWSSTELAMALILGVGAGGVGGYFAGKSAGGDAARGSATATALASAPARPPQASGVVVPLASWSPRLGPEHAKVTILEFSDFQ